MIKIYDNSFIIHTVPLESFYSNESNFILEIDDKDCIRKKLTFVNYGAIRFTPMDAVNLIDYDCVDFKENEYLRVILEDVDSDLIKEFDRKFREYNMNSFNDRLIYHHYIMFVGDHLVEVIAQDCIVENA